MTSVSSASSGSAYNYAMQKKMFDGLDKDQNGSLSEDELLAGKPKDMTKDQASKLYQSMDTNKSGTVTMDEFTVGTASGPGLGLISQLSSDALAVLLQLQQQGGATAGGAGGGGSGDDSSSSDAAYDVLDTNKDGVVSEDEFLAAHPEAVTDNGAKKLFEAFDTDKDGTIDQAQFKQITDAITPPQMMDSFFGTDTQSGDSSSSFGSLASLFGSLTGGPNSAYQLFDLLDIEAQGTTTAAA